MSSLTLPSAQAETAAGVAARTQAAIDKGDAPKWWKPELPEAIQRDVDGKGKRLAGQLKLDDEAKTQKVAARSEHFGRVWAWNQQVADELKGRVGRGGGQHERQAEGRDSRRSPS